MANHEKVLTLHGKPITVRELAELAGVPVNTMHKRLETCSPEKSIRMKARPWHADLSGQTFNDGQLTVIRKAGFTASKKQIYTCLCKCGTTKDVIGSDLKSGRTKSCGCLKSEAAAERQIARAEDLTGSEFASGYVTVIGVSDKYHERSSDKRMSRMWTCRCRCGKTFDALASALRGGQVTSCGCGAARMSRCAATVARIEFFGSKLTLSEISEISERSKSCIFGRMARGMTAEEAALGPMRKTSRKGTNG